MNPGPNPSADHRDRTPAGQAGGRGAAPGREVLVGLVERVTFHNPETGFCVLRIKARGHRDLVTTVGHAATISAGEWITASGEWTNDRTHGLQFRARFLKASAPSSVEGIEKYLGSGMIRGIGPVYATRMVRLFTRIIAVFSMPSRSAHRADRGGRRRPRTGDGGCRLRYDRLLRGRRCAWRDRRGSADEYGPRVSTRTAVERS